MDMHGAFSSHLTSATQASLPYHDRGSYPHAFPFASGDTFRALADFTYEREAEKLFNLGIMASYRYRWPF